MTEEEAVERAWICVRRAGIAVIGVEHAQKLLAGALSNALPAQGDEWVIRFGTETAPDTVDSADVIIVAVDDATGQTKIIPGL